MFMLIRECSEVN